jgi:hypothetical protein
MNPREISLGQGAPATTHVCLAWRSASAPLSRSMSLLSSAGMRLANNFGLCSGQPFSIMDPFISLPFPYLFFLSIGFAFRVARKWDACCQRSLPRRYEAMVHFCVLNMEVEVEVVRPSAPTLKLYKDVLNFKAPVG